MAGQNAEIAVLRWEEGHVPRGLMQLESLVGNSTNPASYPFPVRFHHIRGANIETVLERPSLQVLRTMIEDAKQLASEGVRAISTSCGFNAIFQRELADALDIPVYTSSLLLVPLAQRTIAKNKKIGVITAKKPALKEAHFEAAGVTDIGNTLVFGMDACPEWNKIFTAPQSDVDLDVIAREVLRTAADAKKANPQIAAFVLECTDLPPFADLIRQELCLTVYDYISMIGIAAEAAGVRKLEKETVF